MIQHCTAFKRANDRDRKEAMQILEDMDWIQAIPWERNYNGWPTKFGTNPQIFEMYSHEGAQWRKKREEVRRAITGDEGGD